MSTPIFARANSLSSSGADASVLNDLNDVNSPTPQLGDVVMWNGIEYVNVPVVSGDNIHALNDHSDTEITTPIQGEILTYSTSSSSWVNSPQSTIGSNLISYNYKAETATSPPPSTKKIRWNNATQPSASIVYVNHTNDDGTLISNILEDIVDANDELIVFDSSDTNHFQHWQITGVFPDTNHVRYNITLLNSSGVSFTNNQKIVLYFIIGGATTTVPVSAHGLNDHTDVSIDGSSIGDVLTKTTSGWVGTPLLTSNIEGTVLESSTHSYAVSSWTQTVTSEYELSLVHGLDNDNLIVQHWEDPLGESVIVPSTKTNANTLKLVVGASPDERYGGKTVILSTTPVPKTLVTIGRQPSIFPTISNLLLHLDADGTENFTLVGNDVDVWLDKSGNGNNVPSIDVDKRPLLVENSVNGRYGVDFIGSKVLKRNMTISSQSTYFVVSTSRDGTSADRCVLGGHDATIGSVVEFGNNVSSKSAQILWGGVTKTVASGVNWNTPVVMTINPYDGVSNSVFRVNGGESYNSSHSGTSNAQAITVGDNGDTEALLTSWIGFVYEILIYDRVLTSGEMTQIENYLIDKWTI